ncbi:hypothetical protein I6E72_05010 [Pseudoalteromonas sp. NSLLW24]|uniref:hypothetical protein n=1 Tax=Pseudoalteromonas sp. NSLLW24 TaxID=2792050 RepID=UPI0018CC8966|nr:hypothetical protein [Pseudoalteromonas sp. NSLLW24]MBG9998319.1 hypothetical protein [Pseudoalteromonas sp. NSLLW24]
MILETKTIDEYEFIVNTLNTYFAVSLELRDLPDLPSNDLVIVEQDLQIVAELLQQIEAYHKAYPQTKNKFFYTKLNNSEVEQLLKALHVFHKVNNGKLTEQQNLFLKHYTDEANIFMRDFCNVVYDESLVRGLFNKYKIALKNHCEDAVLKHIEQGNKQVYVFALQAFPGHAYQLATMNTVTSQQLMLNQSEPDDDFDSELYNPACFDIECECSEEYKYAESQIKALFDQLYELNETHCEDGTKEFEEIDALYDLAYVLFIESSLYALKTTDFDTLNKTDMFCAIVALHEFSEYEFYALAKHTIHAKFDQIFPDADKYEHEDSVFEQLLYKY